MWLAFVGCALMSLTACGAGPTRTDDPSKTATHVTSGSTTQSPTVRARMHGHDVHGAAMRDAVARGDVDVARREAKILAELRIEGDIDPTWRKHLGAMNAAAARVAAAKDVVEASRDLPAVARTCGDCHAALGRPGPIVGEPPAEASGTVPRMKRHQWAAERMWDGLVIPSDDAWRAGARVLADAPLEPEALTPGKTPVPKVDALAQSVHDVAHAASGATTPSERAAVYGKVMRSCTDCHQRLGGGPPAPRTR